MKKRDSILAVLALATAIYSNDCSAQAVRVAPVISSSNSGLYYLNGKKGPVSHMEPSVYLQPGIVPEVDGKVVFSKTFDAPGKSRNDIGRILNGWAATRYLALTENGVWTDADYYNNQEFAQVKVSDLNEGRMVCQGDEEQVFSNRTLAKDFTRMQYTLTLNFSDGKLSAKIDNIVYLYVLKDEPERLAAEDYINDKNAFTKKGTLNRMYGKFRAKTVDVTNEIFKELEGLMK